MRAFIVQKKCVRAICGAGPMDSCRPLFRSLGLLTLTGLYILEAGCFVRKYPTYFNKPFQNKRLRERDMAKLSIPPCSSTLYKKNCYVMTIIVYNKIPNTLRELPNNLFTPKLKKWLVEKCYYSVKEFLDDN